ncbi:MAG: histidinol-phosphatase HisJ family protein [Clostridia bacterium]|nr:histidinol-phosphatase HisJ family protein [Clostridia bacterium]
MFDYHMHTSVSFDSEATAMEMATAARDRGLKEICFTDHMDYCRAPHAENMTFDIADYNRAYDGLSVPGLLIRNGVEFGLTTWNQQELEDFLRLRHFDFVLGSIHFAQDVDPYEKRFWEGRRVKESFRVYLEEMLACVKVQDNFDVLGHLTYACKSPHNPTREPLLMKDYREITDEIMRVIIAKGKGMEINSSGVDSVGVFLPSADYLRRFKELGGEIVTMGSDAHNAARVGQYAKEATEILREIFGYVCTFADRKPIFHKL